MNEQYGKNKFSYEYVFPMRLDIHLMNEVNHTRFKWIHRGMFSYAQSIKYISIQKLGSKIPY